MGDYAPGMSDLIEQIVMARMLNPALLQKQAVASHGKWEPLRFESKKDEEDFLQWIAKQSLKVGFELNPNDPNYDYRRAFKANIEPMPSPYDQGRYHWPSGTPTGEWLKSPTHPTGWAEMYMQNLGFDPGTQAAQWLGLIPRLVR